MAADLVDSTGECARVVVLADEPGGTSSDAPGNWLWPLVGGVDQDPLAATIGQLADRKNALKNGLVAGLPVKA
jgi:hypothetical protein